MDQKALMVRQDFLLSIWQLISGAVGEFSNPRKKGIKREVREKPL
jgi:hypothetical protein